MYFCNSRKKINFSFLTFVVVLFVIVSTAFSQSESPTYPSDAAATFTVTNLNDGGAGSLRQAIADANNTSGDDAIVFQSGLTGTIGLTSELLIDTNIAIYGPNFNPITVAYTGMYYSRVFNIAAGATVSISNLTISGGYVRTSNPFGGGGGILNAGMLSLTNTTVSSNRVEGDYASGGGIYSNGTLNLTNCLIANNWVSAAAGGSAPRAEGGGIVANGFIITNTTISGNGASVRGTYFTQPGQAFGGGVLGSGTFRNSTITGNFVYCTTNCAQNGGGIRGGGTFSNTIISNNGSNIGPDISGSVLSEGYNLIGNTSGNSGWVSTDILNQDAKLAPLGDNGGLTKTHALLDGSPAINAGNNADAPATDQRGFSRIVGGTIDIGAFESNSTTVNCSFTINPTNQLVGSSGGNITVNVTGAPGCSWTATSNADWISVISGSSGNGNGTVTLSVQATIGPARTGTVTIAGQTFTVNQSSGCTYTLSPTGANISSNSATSSFNISSGSGCNYTATSNDSFITVTSETSGSGNGTVSYSVARNTGPARTGTITVGRQIFTVNQASGCSFIINPTTQSFTSSGGNGSATVTTENGCTYSTLSNDSWITVTQGASGSGNGTVGFTVAANTGAARTGTLFIAGQTFTVNQAAYVKSRKRVRFF